MANIIGRKSEIAKLEQLYGSGQAEFLAMYGRRRIGKTYLITEYFKDKGIFFQQTGIRKAPLALQLKQFTNEYQEAFNENLATPSSWHEGLSKLCNKVKSLKTQNRIIIFFDELPWLAGPRSQFLANLDHAWNRYLSRDKRIILIVCGSAAAWMIKKVLHHKGGLHGRLTSQMRLLPFSLNETVNFLKNKGAPLGLKETIELYFVLGGVAHYLKNISNTLSAHQNINVLLFSPNGLLFHEFHKLYASLFESPENHIKMVKALAAKPYGIRKQELLKMARLTSGGSSSMVIKELQESGFIGFYQDREKSKKNGYYRLIDEFSLFFLHWVEPLNINPDTFVEKDYWLMMQSQQRYKSWSGYAFENICLKHIYAIKKALGIAGVITKIYSWRSPDKPHMQIDLIIDRSDNVIHLVEIKFYQSKWRLASKDVEDLTKKRQAFISHTQTTKTVFTTVVTPFGIEENTHSRAIIHQSLKAEDLLIR